MAQLPRRIAEHLEPLACGPDTSIGVDVLLAQVSKEMGVSEERAKEITVVVLEALDDLLTGDLFSHVLGQLPRDITALLRPTTNDPGKIEDGF